MNSITELFNHYGYIILYSALALELIALPIPGETLMTYCGFLVFAGKLNWAASIIVATSGVISGITVTYFIGQTAGNALFTKYGAYFHLGPDKLSKTSKWFDDHGNSLLIVSYFIPGVKHVAGYFAGVTGIPLKKFAIKAYIGALLWAATFISLGKILGTKWDHFHGSVMDFVIIGGVLNAVIVLGVYLCKRYKQRIQSFIIKSLKNSSKIFHN